MKLVEEIDSFETSVNGVKVLGFKDVIEAESL